MNAPETQCRPPAHLHETVFRRYEAVIAEVVRKFPEPITRDPKPLSLITYQARLRDAIKSVITYKWPTSIDVERLESIRNEIVVKEHQGLVYIGRECDSIGSIIPSNSANLPSSPAPNSTLTVDRPDKRDLFALAHLISRHHLQGPIRLTNANAAEVSSLVNEGFDVAFREEGPIIYLL